MESNTSRDDRVVPPAADAVPTPADTPASAPPPVARIVPLRRAAPIRAPEPPEDDPGPQAA